MLMQRSARLRNSPRWQQQADPLSAAALGREVGLVNLSVHDIRSSWLRWRRALPLRWTR